MVDGATALSVRGAAWRIEEPLTWPFGDSTTTFRLSKCVITNLNLRTPRGREVSLSPSTLRCHSAEEH